MGRRSSKPDPIPAPTQAPQRVVFDGGAIGLSLARRKSDDRAVVVSVVPNGQASVAGVISGDAVTTVDDGDAGSYSDVVQRLEGRRPVSLGFMRGGELEDILASMTAVKRAFSQTKRAENEQKREQRRREAIQKRIDEMRPATHDNQFNVSLMPPGGCAWQRIQAGAPPPLNHIRDALAKVSGPPPPFIDDMAGKDECWYPTGIGNPRFRSLGYRTLKSMPAYGPTARRHHQWRARTAARGRPAQLNNIDGVIRRPAGGLVWPNGVPVRRRQQQCKSLDRPIRLPRRAVTGCENVLSPRSRRREVRSLRADRPRGESGGDGQAAA